MDKNEITTSGIIRIIRKYKKCDSVELPCFVYFIEDGKYVKIGVAKNVKSRFAVLQTANSTELRLIALIPCLNSVCAFSCEKELHTYLKEKKCRGEWYDIRNFVIDSEYFTRCLNEKRIASNYYYNSWIFHQYKSLIFQAFYEDGWRSNDRGLLKLMFGMEIRKGLRDLEKTDGEKGSEDLSQSVGCSQKQ